MFFNNKITKSLAKILSVGTLLYNSCSLVELPETPTINNNPTTETTSTLKESHFKYCISKDTTLEKIILFTDYYDGFTTVRLNHDDNTRNIARAFAESYYTTTFNNKTYYFSEFNENSITLNDGNYLVQILLKNDELINSILTLKENSELSNQLYAIQDKTNLSLNTENFGRIAFYIDNNTDPFIAIDAEENNDLITLSKYIQKDENGLYITSELFNKDENEYESKKIYFHLDGFFQDESPVDYYSGNIYPTIKIEDKNSTLIKLLEATKTIIYGASIDTDKTTNNTVINYILNPFTTNNIPESYIKIPDAEEYVTFIAPIGEFSDDGTSIITIPNGINDANDLNYDNIKSLKIYNLK